MVTTPHQWRVSAGNAVVSSKAPLQADAVEVYAPAPRLGTGTFYPPIQTVGSFEKLCPVHRLSTTAFPSTHVLSRHSWLHCGRTVDIEGGSQKRPLCARHKQEE